MVSNVIRMVLKMSNKVKEKLLKKAEVKKGEA